MNYFAEGLKKYVQFNGRARRAEYWNFVLYSTLITIVLGIIESTAGMSSVFSQGALSMFFNLFVLLPSLAVSVRRLHDTNTSGWFMLIAIIPLIGMIALIYKFVKEGDTTANQYGANPKEATHAQV